LAEALSAIEATLHEARHTFASPMIAAGMKALSSYAGRSSIAITYDRYGHLMPGTRRQPRSWTST
jgi:integrase